jgi:drug/metabolite transporter (DMT)-like permease
VAGMGLTAYSICYYTAQGHVEAGTTSVLSNFYTPITIVLSTLFLKETLHGWQIFGATLLILAAFIVSKKHRTGRLSFDKYFWLMIFAGLFLSIFLLANTQLMRMTGFTTSTILSWWAACLGLGIVKIFFPGKTTYSKKDLAITGGLKFLQDLSWTILVYIIANLSLVSAVTTFKVVLIFLLAALFLRERDDLGLKILGSAIAVIGLFLMR